MSRLSLLIFQMGGANTGGVGGAERVMAELYNNLNSKIDAELFTFDNRESAYSISQSKKINNINRLHISKILDKIPLFHLLLKSIDYSYEIKRNNISYTLSFDERTHVINILSSIFCKTKTIVSLRNNPTPPDDGWFKRIQHKLLLYFIIKRSIAIIVNSKELKMNLDEKYSLPSDRIKVIYNPKNIVEIQQKMLEPIVEFEVYSGDKPIILSVGRLCQQKGQWHLLRIFAELQNRIESHLVICGAGDLKDRLIKLASQLKISNKVTFTGWVDNSYKYMHFSDVFVMTSLYEGQPNALIEAMICECPVIAAKCQYGPAEILLDDEKSGILTTELDIGNFDSTSPLSEAEKEILESLVLVLTDNDYRENLIISGLKRGTDFSNKKICQQYNEVLYNIINTYDK